MMGEFLLRLAVALPLVCAAAALALWAVKRGWIGLPRMARMPRPGPILDLRASCLLGPGVRLAVVRFGGRDLLIGQSGGSIALISSADPSTPRETPCEP
jgi:flagellar biogenesis protein FliO